PVERNPVEQDLDVGEGVDRDPDASDLLLDVGVVGVMATLGRQVEGNRQTCPALRQQILVALVGLLGRTEAGVLPEGPELASIPLREVAAGERKRSWRRHPLSRRQALRAIAHLERDARLAAYVGHAVTLLRTRFCVKK